MARARYTDYLQVNKFHVFDVSMFRLGVPVLIPIFGFRSVSLPTITAQYKEIKEGNVEYRQYGALERAEVTPITLEQGVSLINSDFYDWIRKAISGEVAPRNLLLIQFTNINPTSPTSGVSKKIGNAASQVSNVSSFIPGTSGLGGFGLYEDGVRIPGRAWYLKGCKPLSYKPGTDFDATSGEVSLATLEVGITEMEEFSLGI